MTSTNQFHTTNLTWLAHALSLDHGLTPQAANQPTELDPTTLDPGLADFQAAAVTRALTLIHHFGGAILADGVGLGKTRMGLAIARSMLQNTTSPDRVVYLCIPARLRSHWQRTALSSGWQIPSQLQCITHTELSRPNPALNALIHSHRPALILVDEAHHFRNPQSQRSQNLARLAAHAPILLLTATPICNSIWDLYHLLSLFLAEHDLRAHIGMNLRDAFTHAQQGTFDLTELAKILVIRRRIAPETTHFGHYPSVRLKILNYDAPPDERWIWQNLATEINRLSLTLLHDDWPRQLFQEFILKRWESGCDALAETLRTLTEYHRRWLEAHTTGHTLSRPHFHKLFPDAASHHQSVFPFLYEKPHSTSSSPPNNPKSIPTIKNDLHILQNLLHRTQKLTHAHAGANIAITSLLDQPSAPDSNPKLLIFTGYQHAAEGIYRTICTHLGPHARAGLVTGRTARATGLGKTNAHDIIRRFAPRAAGEPDMPRHHQLDILVCTDCLSEGIDLQDCNRLVLADLPYTPLRVEQRIGRLMRPSTTNREVTVYLPRPNDWNDSLGLRRRLHTKLDLAQSAGTNFEYAAVLQSTNTPANPKNATPHIEPLAALTTLDQLAARLIARTSAPTSADFPPDPIFYRNATAIPDLHQPLPQLWLRAVLENGPHPIWLWCKVDATAHIEMRTPALVKDLITLADFQCEIIPGPPDPDMLQAATRALQTRLHHIQAARLAPMPLGPETPQQKIWQQLGAWMHQTPTLPESCNPDQLRQRLLQPFPRGTERNLTELLDQNLAPEHLFHRINQLQLTPPPQKMNLRIVLGLQLNPSA